MKALVTGMGGTVAPAVAERLKADGHQIARWDRSAVPIDDLDAIRGFIGAERPDWFLHLATGSPDWAENAARVCAELGTKFLFTSSVSVFSGSQAGPLSVRAVPDATDDYGRYKIECERRVRAATPQAIVARLGWQIGDAPGSNNMVDFLHRTAAKEGRIEASQRWFPACSHLKDTADSLYGLLQSHPPGLYHLEGNPGLSFHEIAVRLNRLQGGVWTVVAGDAPVLDNRMVDDRIVVEPITSRLGERVKSN